MLGGPCPVPAEIRTHRPDDRLAESANAHRSMWKGQMYLEPHTKLAITRPGRFWYVGSELDSAVLKKLNRDRQLPAQPQKKVVKVKVKLSLCTP